MRMECRKCYTNRDTMPMAVTQMSLNLLAYWNHPGGKNLNEMFPNSVSLQKATHIYLSAARVYLLLLLFCEGLCCSQFTFCTHYFPIVLFIVLVLTVPFLQLLFLFLCSTQNQMETQTKLYAVNFTEGQGPGVHLSTPTSSPICHLFNSLIPFLIFFQAEQFSSFLLSPSPLCSVLASCSACKTANFVFTIRYLSERGIPILLAGKSDYSHKLISSSM